MNNAQLIAYLYSALQQSAITILPISPMHHTRTETDGDLLYAQIKSLIAMLEAE